MSHRYAAIAICSLVFGLGVGVAEAQDQAPRSAYTGSPDAADNFNSEQSSRHAELSVRACLGHAGASESGATRSQTDTRGGTPLGTTIRFFKWVHLGAAISMEYHQGGDVAALLAESARAERVRRRASAIASPPSRRFVSHFKTSRGPNP